MYLPRRRSPIARVVGSCVDGLVGVLAVEEHPSCDSNAPPKQSSPQVGGGPIGVGSPELRRDLYDDVRSKVVCCSRRHREVDMGVTMSGIPGMAIDGLDATDADFRDVPDHRGGHGCLPTITVITRSYDGRQRDRGVDLD